MTDAIHPGDSDGRSPAAKRGLFDRKEPEPEVYDIVAIGDRCGNPECGSYKMYPHCNHLDCTSLWCDRCLWTKGECDREGTDTRIYPDHMRPGSGVERKHFKPVTTVGRAEYRYSGQGMERKLTPMEWAFDYTSKLPSWPNDELLAMLEVVEHIQALPGPDTW